MKKIIALVIGIAYVFGTAGFAAAQAPTPSPKAEDKMDKKMGDDKKAAADKKAADKKAAADKATGDKKAAADKKAADKK
jgi:colicin import membrane protein